MQYVTQQQKLWKIQIHNIKTKNIQNAYYGKNMYKINPLNVNCILLHL
jgi:hypothetical protein